MESLIYADAALPRRVANADSRKLLREHPNKLLHFFVRTSAIC